MVVVVVGVAAFSWRWSCGTRRGWSGGWREEVRVVVVVVVVVGRELGGRVGDGRRRRGGGKVDIHITIIVVSVSVGIDQRGCTRTEMDRLLGCEGSEGSR